MFSFVISSKPSSVEEEGILVARDSLFIITLHSFKIILPIRLYKSFFPISVFIDLCFGEAE